MSKFDELKQRLACVGFTYEPVWLPSGDGGPKHETNPKAFQVNGSSYPTFRNEPLGVTLAITTGALYWHNHRIWVTNAIDCENEFVLNFLVSDVERKGYADQALALLVEAIKDNKSTIYLDATPCRAAVGKTGRNISATKLRAWYARHGFRPVDDTQGGRLMVLRSIWFSRLGEVSRQPEENLAKH